MHNLDLSITGLSKVEGHASLTVKVRNGKVLKSRLEIEENRRFFEQMSVGKDFKTLPDFMSRICGTCSPAHFLTTLEAVEDAFNVKISRQTLVLRHLIEFGMYIRDHSLHLLIFSLPDYLGKKSILDFKGREHEYLHLAMRLQKLGSNLSRLVAGRALHPISARIGGFRNFPSEQEIDAVLKELLNGRKDALKLIDLFSSFHYVCHQPTVYSALVNKDYTFLEGKICASTGLCINERDYLKHLKEKVVPYSNAKQSELQGKEFLVGALSRMNLNQKSLHKGTGRVIKEKKIKLVCFSPFSNNLAQAIEVLHCLDCAVELLRSLKIRQEKIPEFRPRAKEGIGVTEAPRGTLYHAYKFNALGKVSGANIVVPTAQNAKNIEKDVKLYLSYLTGLKKNKTEIRTELEKLIRAYDPCFSCSTHFLKMKWV